MSILGGFSQRGDLDIPALICIKFGFIMEDRNFEFLFDNLIILGKCFIHKCKFLKVNSFPMFHNYFERMTSFF